jgi:hypothetical protein
MYSLKIWCDDGNEWRRMDIEWRLDEGQIKVGRTLDKITRRKMVGRKTQDGKAQDVGMTLR